MIRMRLRGLADHGMEKNAHGSKGQHTSSLSEDQGLTRALRASWFLVLPGEQQLELGDHAVF